MTTTPETPVTVEQCDIDRAEAFYPPWMHNRLSAISALSEQFARHRIDATRDLAAEVERLKADKHQLTMSSLFQSEKFKREICETEAQLAEARALLHDTTAVIGHLVPMDAYILAGRKMVAKDVWEAARAFLSRTDSAEPSPLPQNVITLVIAAREAWENLDGQDFMGEEALALDNALKPFAALVPFEDEPDGEPASNPCKLPEAAPVDVHYVIEWAAAPRPPVHPTAMIGRCSFASVERAQRHMDNQARDARFISLTEVRTQRSDASHLIQQKGPEDE